MSRRTISIIVTLRLPTLAVGCVGASCARYCAAGRYSTMAILWRSGPDGWSDLSNERALWIYAGCGQGAVRVAHAGWLRGWLATRLAGGGLRHADFRRHGRPVYPCLL